MPMTLFNQNFIGFELVDVMPEPTTNQTFIHITGFTRGNSGENCTPSCSFETPKFPHDYPQTLSSVIPHNIWSGIIVPTLEPVVRLYRPHVWHAVAQAMCFFTIFVAAFIVMPTQKSSQEGFSIFVWLFAPAGSMTAVYFVTLQLVNRHNNRVDDKVRARLNDLHNDYRVMVLGVQFTLRAFVTKQNGGWWGGAAAQCHRLVVVDHCLHSWERREQDAQRMHRDATLGLPVHSGIPVPANMALALPDPDVEPELPVTGYPAATVASRHELLPEAL